VKSNDINKSQSWVNYFEKIKTQKNVDLKSGKSFHGRFWSLVNLVLDYRALQQDFMEHLRLSVQRLGFKKGKHHSDLQIVYKFHIMKA
jgi:hypothetical protein